MRLDPKVADDLYLAAQRVVEKCGIPGQDHWRNLQQALAEAKANDTKNRLMMQSVHQNVTLWNESGFGRLGFSYKLPHDPGGYGT